MDLSSNSSILTSNKLNKKESQIAFTPSNYVIQEVTESPFRTSYDLHINNLGTEPFKQDLEAFSKIKQMLGISSSEEVVTKVEFQIRQVSEAKITIELAEKLKKLYCKLLARSPNEITLPEVWRWIKGIINNFRELASHKLAIKQF